MAAYGGFLVGESMSEEIREAVTALPDVIRALEVIRDADDDCGSNGLPHNLPRHIRDAVDAALAKAGIPIKASAA